ncbi:hypothetical protein AKJ37_06805, partial [candidate division MSBL1 archaeon SCGC-AAA259I09]
MEDFFGSEEGALGRIREGDVASLSTVPGLTEAKASRIVRSAIAEEYRAVDLLQTEVVERICEEVLKKIRRGAQTAYGEAKLSIYFPIGSKERISNVQDWVRKALNTEVGDGTDEMLEGVSPLSPPNRTRIGDRAVVTSDPEKIEEARKAFPEVAVELVENRRELRGVAANHERVILIDEAIPWSSDASERLDHKPGAVDDPVEIVPERVLSFFAENAEAVRNAINVWKSIDAPPSGLFEGIDDGRIDEVEGLLSRLDPTGGVKGNEGVKRVGRALNELDGSIADAEARINEEIESVFGEREIRVEGTHILDLVKQKGEAKDLIRSELESEFDRAVDEAVGNLVSDLELDFEEKDLACDLFPREPELPVERNEQVADRLKKRLRRKYSRKSLNAKTELAKELRGYEEDVRKLVEGVLELDVALAVKRFAEEHGMTLPEFGEKGFKIRGGRNLLLEDPEPIDYRAEEATLLTGVNSGGKTTTLDLVAQVYVLARMGFPVPAEEAVVEPVDRIYYYRPSKNTMNSGAFEGALRKFENVLELDGSKLVLADELENITEPGASARI